MPKISVIIPIYNVEKYLKKCLDSVIHQTLKDIEIICINDCSTDGSLAILIDYVQKDKRIKLINLSQNKGVSFARNRGIEEASGKYIAFLDSDDWCEKDLAEKTYKKIVQEDADIVQFAHNRVIGEKLVPCEISDKIKNVIAGTKYNEYFMDFVNFAWDKVYKSSFIKDKKIKFPLNVHPTEDVIFALECFSYNPKVIFIPECLSDYRIERDGSAMKNYQNLVTNQIEAANVMFNSEFYKNSDNEYKKLCIQKILGGVLYFCALSISKKCPMQIYISKLRELVLYIQKEVPKELIESFKEFENLERFTLLSSKIKQN